MYVSMLYLFVCALLDLAQVFSLPCDPPIPGIAPNTTISANGYCFAIIEDQLMFPGDFELTCLARRNASLTIPSTDVFIQLKSKVKSTRGIYYASPMRLDSYSLMSPWQCSCENKYLETPCDSGTMLNMNKYCNSESLNYPAELVSGAAKCVYLSITSRLASFYVSNSCSKSVSHVGTVCQFGAEQPEYVKCPTVLPGYERTFTVDGINLCVFIVATETDPAQPLSNACKKLHPNAEVLNEMDTIFKKNSIAMLTSLFKFDAEVLTISRTGGQYYQPYQIENGDLSIQHSFFESTEKPHVVYPLTLCKVSTFVYYS